MKRLTSALLLGGGVLLVSYISAPAAPTPAVAPVPLAVMMDIDATAPLAAELTQETEQLRARLTNVPASPTAKRDPFNFGVMRRTPRPAAPVTAAPEVVAEPSAPPIAWPSLVAVLTSGGETPTHTAVLGVGDSIEMLTVGGTHNGFLVTGVTATSVELVHAATNTATRLSIR
jgi:hypothetical protein